MKKVLILFGGNSFEHEISCMSVNFIKNNIDTKIFEFKLVGIDFNNKWFEVNFNKTIDMNWKNNVTMEINNIIKYLKNFDIVFPLIHGNSCEDGKLQSIFELYNIKYVGSNSYGSLICYDKLLTKLILEKYNIPQVPYAIYDEKKSFEYLDYPVIVKPCKCGSSIGINIAKNKKELKKAIQAAKKYDKNIIIEKYLSKKRELECAIINKKNKLIVSNAGEVMNNNTFYNFSSKYQSNTNISILHSEKTLNTNIKNYSKLIYKILECKDMARIDFFLDLKTHKLYFNEINTIPGFTKNSMFPLLIKNSGINYKKMITLLLND